MIRLLRAGSGRVVEVEDVLELRDHALGEAHLKPAVQLDDHVVPVVDGRKCVEVLLEAGVLRELPLPVVSDDLYSQPEPGLH